MTAGNQRGPKTTKDLINEILRLKKTNPALSAEDIRKQLQQTFKKSPIPKERAIYNIIKKNKDKVIFDPVDGPWSIGSCMEYGIPGDYIPLLTELNGSYIRLRDKAEVDVVKGYKMQGIELDDVTMPQAVELYKRTQILTIRHALWIVKLYPMMQNVLNRPEEKKKYPSHIQQIGFMGLVSDLYARVEIISTITNTTLDTSDLDSTFFSQNPIPKHALVQKHIELFMPGMAATVKQAFEDQDKMEEE